jgi:hypothetical protein
MLTLAHGTTLKRHAVAYTAQGVLDVYRLLLLDNIYRVHVERMERSGRVGEAILFEGTNLDDANRVFNRLTS